MVLVSIADDQAEAARRACEPQLDGTARAGLAAAEHVLGNEDRSIAILAELIEKHPRRAAYLIAKAYDFPGNSQLAFEWLDNSFHERAKLLADLQSEPAFRAWHGDSRYQALLRKMKLAE